MRKNTICAGLALAASVLVSQQRAQADILPGSFWPNGTLENASTTEANAPSLSDTVGGAGTWRRGGADYGDPSNPGPYTYDFWDNSKGTVSGSHALVLVDNSTTTNGEWFTPSFDVDKSPVPVVGGQTVEIRFFWNYQVSISPSNGNGADMRVTIQGTDGTTTDPAGDLNEFGLHDYTTPQTDPLDPYDKTTNGQFVVADYTLAIPNGVTGLFMNIASGGDAGVTGFLAVDDISVRYTPEPASAMGLTCLGGMLLRRKAR